MEEISNLALWFNETFASFDYSILSFMHSIAVLTNNFITPLARLISFLSDDGIFLIIISFFLMLFKRTRKIGVCMFGSLAIAIIITKLGLKDIVSRPRPFYTNETYLSWWKYIGTTNDTSFCFPSGHTYLTMAAMTSLFIYANKKIGWTGFLCVVLVGLSRIYLIAHYPSDIIGAIIIGAIFALIAYAITTIIFKICNKYKDNKICNFILEFNITDLKNKM